MLLGSLKSERRTAYRYIIMLALSLKLPKNGQRKRWKLPLSTIPLSFHATSPGNLREYPNKPYIARKQSHILGYIFAADISVQIFVKLVKFGDIRYKFKSSQGSKAGLQSSKHTGLKQSLMQNGHSRSFKVTCFGLSGKVIRN